MDTLLPEFVKLVRREYFTQKTLITEPGIEPDSFSVVSGDCMIEVYSTFLFPTLFQPPIHCYTDGRTILIPFAKDIPVYSGIER